MIENIQMATKNELQNEMTELENAFMQKKKELSEKTEEMVSKIREIQEEMSGLSTRYAVIKAEIDKREGKNTK